MTTLKQTLDSLAGSQLGLMPDFRANQTEEDQNAQISRQIDFFAKNMHPVLCELTFDVAMAISKICLKLNEHYQNDPSVRYDQSA